MSNSETRNTQCPTCKGDGQIMTEVPDDAPIVDDCPDCKGTGIQPKAEPIWTPNFIQEEGENLWLTYEDKQIAKQRQETFANGWEAAVKDVQGCLEQNYDDFKTVVDVIEWLKSQYAGKEALPNKNAPQSEESPAAIPSPGVDKGSIEEAYQRGIGEGYERMARRYKADPEYWGKILLKERLPIQEAEKLWAALSPNSEPQEAITDPLPNKFVQDSTDVQENPQNLDNPIQTIEQILKEATDWGDHWDCPTDCAERHYLLEAKAKIQTLITQATITELERLTAPAILENENIFNLIVRRLARLKEKL